ncbi:hypothetical protein [Clostridium minihomine]|uniref:hypothetical protein n=1 Tax=Clostridium minihomine TaxID=2045012 RepID=UPI000C78770B|nr:hypothetical protein [Clostridium minihomine]
MKISHRTRNLIIGLAAVVVLVFSFGLYQYQQMSNLIFRIHIPSNFVTIEQYVSPIPTFKDGLVNRRATEFSAFLEQLEFKRGDDSFLQTDADYLSGDASNSISITVENDSESVVKNFLVFKKEHQKYLLVDVQDTYPDQYAVVEGEPYDYLYAKLSHANKKDSSSEPVRAEGEEGTNETPAPVSGKLTTRRVYKDVTAGPMKARLYADVEIHSGDSLSQVNRVIKMGWEQKSGGSWQLEDAMTDWWLEQTPSTGVNFRGSAVFTAKTTSNATGEFSLESLSSQGFDVSNVANDGSAQLHIRKTVDLEFGYSTI